jgi:hypothetical protein
MALIPTGGGGYWPRQFWTKLKEQCEKTDKKKVKGKEEEKKNNMQSKMETNCRIGKTNGKMQFFGFGPIWIRMHFAPWMWIWIWLWNADPDPATYLNISAKVKIYYDQRSFQLQNLIFLYVLSSRLLYAYNNIQIVKVTSIQKSNYSLGAKGIPFY